MRNVLYVAHFLLKIGVRATVFPKKIKHKMLKFFRENAKFGP